MSKDFEQAYRELAESEIPDLWERIEAGLESKPTPDQIEEEEAVYSERKDKKRKWFYFNRYSGIAAAAVCVVVIIPAAILLFRIGSWRSGRSGSGAATTTEGIDTAAQDDALEFAADEEESCEAAPEDIDAGSVAGAIAEASQEAAEAEEGSGREQMRAQDDVQGSTQSNAQSSAQGNLQSSMEGGSQNAAAEKAMDEMADTAQAMDVADSGNENKETGAEAGSTLKQNEIQGAIKQESAKGESETDGSIISLKEIIEGTIFEHVVVKVVEVKNDFERKDGSLPGTLYTVTIQKNASGQLKVGEQLMIDVPAQSSIALFKDGVFEVDLIYQGNGTYGLEEYYKQIEE